MPQNGVFDFYSTEKGVRTRIFNSKGEGRHGTPISWIIMSLAHYYFEAVALRFELVMSGVYAGYLRLV